MSEIYKAINAVQADLAKVGISKGRTNTIQNYKFRGIDDVYNAVSSLLAAHGLCILPRFTEREVVERVSAKGGALFYVTVKGEFDFVSAADGSKHMVGPIYGEAMDSGDKATNKAMSAAYKYALMEAFAIPTEGDNDADATTHEVAPKTEAQQNALQELRDASLNGQKALEVQWKATPEGIRAALTANSIGDLKALRQAAALVEKQAA